MVEPILKMNRVKKHSACLVPFFCPAMEKIFSLFQRDNNDTLKFINELLDNDSTIVIYEVHHISGCDEELDLILCSNWDVNTKMTNMFVIVFSMIYSAR